MLPISLYLLGTIFVHQLLHVRNYANIRTRMLHYIYEGKATPIAELGLILSSY